MTAALIALAFSPLLFAISPKRLAVRIRSSDRPRR